MMICGGITRDGAIFGTYFIPCGVKLSRHRFWGRQVEQVVLQGSAA